MVGGLPVTRPSRIVTDLMDDQEDPAAVAYVVADAIGAAMSTRAPSRTPSRLMPPGSGSGAGMAWRCFAGCWTKWPTREGPDPVTSAHSYGSPASFRQALTDKLKALAATSRWALPQLQRQMAYDRILERLYLVDDSWIVKGATALLAREIGVRATIDIDVYRPAAREVAEADLRRAAAMDNGDRFRFEVGGPRPVADAGGVRLPVTAFVGNTAWAAFHVDLVATDLQMTGEPEGSR